MLKERLRGSRIPFLHHQQILFDLLDVKLRRNGVKMQRYVSNASHVIVKCTQAFSTNNDFLFKLFVKLFESCYLSTSTLNQGSLLFFHVVHSCIVLVYCYKQL